MQSGAVPFLVGLLSHANEKVLSPALRAVGNIATGTDAQTDVLIESDVCRLLLPLLTHPRKNIRKEVCWTISSIMAGTTEQIQSAIDAGIIPPLIDRLRHDELEVQKEAAWAIGNALTKSEPVQIDFLVRHSVLPPLVALLGKAADTKIVLVCLEAIENVLHHGMLRAQQRADGENEYVQILEQCRGLERFKALVQHPSKEIYLHSLKILEAFFAE